MGDETVTIENFRLRMRGMSAEEAHSLGQEVVNRLSEGLSDRLSSRQLGALNIKVSVPAGTPRNNIAPIVARAILRGLR